MGELFRKEYQKLRNPTNTITEDWLRKRGLQFEKILGQMFDAENIENKINIQPMGEQIDGYIYHCNQHFLIEAKWLNKRVNASTIYSFKGKLDGKLKNTIGIFISISGYSKDCINALRTGKDLNIILFDGKDIDAIIDEKISFAETLKIKLREASTLANIYYNVFHSQIKLDEYEKLVQSLSKTFEPSQIIIICEGETDRIVIEELVRVLLLKFIPDKKVSILTAGGVNNIPYLAGSLTSMGGINFIIADADMASKNAIYNSNLPYFDPIEYEIILIEPNIETAWLKKSKEDIYNEESDISKIHKYWEFANEWANSIDFDNLENYDSSMKVFIDAMRSNKLRV